jgi:lipopolysaccharide transport system ATP-binding protein
MSDTVIKVEDLGKLYRLGEVGTGTISHDLNRWWARVRGKEDPIAKIGETNDRTQKGNSDYVWALKDINFEVKQGEVLGIIGRNGAGKSTLLKILSKVTTPSHGNIKIKGRIASLLEVGTGFHPELTGRENIFLNGAILGMTKAEIRSKFDEIVDFSGVERYIDTPVKRYSSGMYVRLAFAVAAFLEPEILIVDEVLAVGDIEFQKKCLGRMKDVSSKDGRTVLFVSHDMQAVATLTNYCAFLINGTIHSYGETRGVINTYLNFQKVNENIYISRKDDSKPHVKRVEVKTSLVNNVHECTEKLELEFLLFSPVPIKDACFSFQIVDSKGRNYVHQWIFDTDTPYFREAGCYRLNCIIPSLRLYMGKYYLKCYFTESPGGDIFEILEDICPFEIVMYKVTRSKFQWYPESCAYLEDASWVINKII